MKAKIITTCAFFVTCLCHAVEPQIEATLQQHLNERIDRELNQSIIVGIISPYGEQFITAGNLEKDNLQQPDENTIFEIGGVTKVFTAATAADLVQARQLTWKTNAAALLPKNARPPVFDGQSINLHQLATHSTGLPPMPLDLEPADMNNPLADYDTSALYQDMARTGYAFKPGSFYLHSDLGYGLLGHMLELRMDQPYEAIVQERITGPMQLDDTVVTLSDEQQGRLAQPHDGVEATDPTQWGALQGAGALYSTAEDLLTFLKAQMGMIKSPKAKAFAVTHSSILPTGAEDTMVGYAWQITRRGGTTLYWHNGLTRGSAAFIGFNPARRTAVVVLSNTSQSVDEIGFYALAPDVFPLGEFPRLPRLPVAMLERYTGSYEVTPGQNVVITREGSRLYVQFPGAAKYRLYPVNENRFGLAKGEMQLVFDNKSRGQSRSLTVQEKLSSYNARRVQE